MTLARIVGNRCLLLNRAEGTTYSVIMPSMKMYQSN